MTNPAMRTIDVHYLPQFVAEADLAGGTVVMIDLLRASTTICHALAAGAREVAAYGSLSQLMEAASELLRSEITLGGERQGLKIEGFDLGNSPAEYTADQVFGRSVFFTSTNGAMALDHARLAGRLVIGAMANLTALAEAIREATAIHILCAGTNGHVTREDMIASGAIVHELTSTDRDRKLNDAAEATRAEWQELLTAARVNSRSVDEELAEELRRTPHGKTLIDLGFDSDLDLCAQRDTAAVVPERDTQTGRFVLNP